MHDRTNLVNQNPLYSVLLLAKVLRLDPQQGLERTYYLGKNNKVLKTLKAAPGLNNDLSKLDHNRVLDLYPEYEYIFGPYIDASKEEFNAVYLLYTNRINQPNEIRVLYAGRILQEHDTARSLDYCDSMRDEAHYKSVMIARQVLPGKVSNHCYYRPHRWSAEEMMAIRKIYSANSCTQPSFNTLRENYNCTITLSPGEQLAANVYRVMYEIYHGKKRLTSSQVVYSANGRKADIRPDNVLMRDVDEEDRIKRQEAFDLYGLDTYALERIYARTGFNRFRGIYIYDGLNANPGNFGRRYVKLVRDGTDDQHTLLLSRALVTVQEGRVLTDDETVDHIDHDSQNDQLSNLRILSRSTHVAQESVRVEIDPVECGVCGNHFLPSLKAFSYYKLNPYLPVCTPRCKTKLKTLSAEVKAQRLLTKRITYRYYVLDKVTKKPKYFAEGMEYDECRQKLFSDGAQSFKT